MWGMWGMPAPHSPPTPAGRKMKRGHWFCPDCQVAGFGSKCWYCRRSKHLKWQWTQVISAHVHVQEDRFVAVGGTMVAVDRSVENVLYPAPLQMPEAA